VRTAIAAAKKMARSRGQTGTAPKRIANKSLAAGLRSRRS
jgi:hypothetical protein